MKLFLNTGIFLTLILLFGCTPEDIDNSIPALTDRSYNLRIIEDAVVENNTPNSLNRNIHAMKYDTNRILLIHSEK